MFGSCSFHPRLARKFQNLKDRQHGALLARGAMFPFLASSHPRRRPPSHPAGCSLQVKEATERALQAKNLPLDVSVECLTLRESRRAIDVVRDLAEEELRKEVKVIDKAKRELQQKVNEAFEQLW